MKRVALAVAVGLSLALPAPTAAVSGITVFAAASLANVFPKIDDGPRYSFGGSDSLALQLRNGAPVDVFASASPAQAVALSAMRRFRSARTRASSSPACASRAQSSRTS